MAKGEAILEDTVPEVPPIVRWVPKKKKEEVTEESEDAVTPGETTDG